MEHPSLGFDFSQAAKIYSVSEITSEIKEILTTSFPAIWVEGEISNFKYHSSGHRYFTLKDEGAAIKTVIFRNAGVDLDFDLTDGLKVLAFGRIGLYEPQGNYQLIVEQILPSGIGRLYLEFEKLKKKLATEGLFDESRKKPPPRYPFRVGVITSQTGAVFHDIQKILNRRANHIQIVFRPTFVQGSDAPSDIVHALCEMDRHPGIDVIILARGGGSIEDLWAFNEESVARQIAACDTPIISAVGHETDFTISDFVADRRAATPSAAAEIVSPAKEEILNEIQTNSDDMIYTVQGRINDEWQRLDSITTRYGFQQPTVFIDKVSTTLNELSGRIKMLFDHRVRIERQKLDHLISSYGFQQLTSVFGRFSEKVSSYRNEIIFAAHHKMKLKETVRCGLDQRLHSSNPKNILGRGYSIVLTIPERQSIKSVKHLHPGDPVGILMSDGELVASVKQIEKKEIYRQ